MKQKPTLQEQSVIIGMYRNGANYNDMADYLDCHQWLIVKCILEYFENKNPN